MKENDKRTPPEIPSQPTIKQTVREKFLEEIAKNPRFKEAPKTGTGFVIGGVRPPPKS